MLREHPRAGAFQRFFASGNGRARQRQAGLIKQAQHFAVCRPAKAAAQFNGSHFALGEGFERLLFFLVHKQNYTRKTRRCESSEKRKGKNRKKRRSLAAYLQLSKALISDMQDKAPPAAAVGTSYLGFRNRESTSLPHGAAASLEIIGGIFRVARSDEDGALVVPQDFEL